MSDNDTTAVTDLRSRLESIERQVISIRAEMRSEVKKAAHELCDDSDFANPYWEKGAERATNYIYTKAARTMLMYGVGAVVAAGLLWLGSLGVFFK